MSHRNAPLTAAGRLRLVERCQYRPIAHVAAEAGLSRQCLSKWVGRYRQCGQVGLLDRSSVPHASPSQLAPQVVELIEAWRRDRKWSARTIATELAAVGHRVSAATVGRWFVRLGINRRRDLDPGGDTNRRPATIIARYPGHMIHLDVKKVGRIPDGSGWRAHGRGSDADRAAQRAKAKRHGGARAGYVYLHSAVDGFSRLAYTEHLPDETAATTIGFFHRARGFFAAHGIGRIVRVVTDNGPNYRAGPSSAPCPRSPPGTTASGPTPHATTAKSSATSGSWPKKSSTPAPGPAKPNEPKPSRSGTSTTTTIEHTPPSETNPQPHNSVAASPTL